MAKKRRLQVGTLEGIWAETNDMLENEKLFKAFLNLIVSLTKAQNEELGLALRLTFFEERKFFLINYLYPYLRLLKSLALKKLPYYGL